MNQSTNQSIQSSPWPWLLGGCACLFYFYQYLLRVMPSAMTVQLMERFHLNPIAFANLMGVYYYIYIPMQLIVGIALDRFGPRQVLTLALLTCVAGAWIFGDATVLWQLIVGRLLMGLGSSFAFIGALKIASECLLKDRFAFMTGVTTAFGMLGGLVGDILLVRAADHWIFIIGIVLALLIFLLSKQARQFHLQSITSLRAGCLGLWQLMKNPQIWISSLIGCLLYMPVSGFAETWGMSYLMGADHLSKSEASAAISMLFLGWIGGAPLFGWVSDRIRSRRLPLTVAATVATILLSIILYVPDLKVHTIFVLLFLLGLFLSGQIIVFAISRDLSPKPLIATGIAITNMIVMLAGISITAIGFLLNLPWENDLMAHVPIYAWDFQLALSILPLCLVIAVFLTFYLQETARSN